MSIFAVGIDAPPQSIAGPVQAASASTSTSAPAPTPARPDWRAVDLRTLALEQQLSSIVLGEMAGAKSVLHWHSRHRYCANCGTPTTVGAGGWRRDCSACNAQHFPRVDPVVIMLLIDGERCVLGRQPQFASGMYSALAGFLEPGETMEDAVRREIMEEAGVTCSQVTYFASQPWPFPSSLMIACFARATQTTLTIDATELEDARWFTRAEVATMLQGEHPDALSAPKPYAIAHHLLQHFVRHGSAVLDGINDFIVE
jgi:NAD+ diphosphatase